MGTMALGWMTMAAVSDRPARRPSVDLASVPPSQWGMHDRLTNWSRWCHGGSGESGRTAGASPMFLLYRSSEARRVYGEETTVPIDKEDALKIHFAIVHPMFDPRCRRALQWCYLRNCRAAPAMAREVGKSLEGLAELVRAGRLLLIEKGV